MSGCGAKVRPFPDSTELECERDDAHDRHMSVLNDYAYPGSRTELTWEDSDRRSFRGEWKPCQGEGGVPCVLPAGHRGNHAA